VIKRIFVASQVWIRLPQNYKGLLVFNKSFQTLLITRSLCSKCAS